MQRASLSKEDSTTHFPFGYRLVKEGLPSSLQVGKLKVDSTPADAAKKVKGLLAAEKGAAAVASQGSKKRPLDSDSRGSLPSKKTKTLPKPLQIVSPSN